MLEWYTSLNGVYWEPMPSPSTYKIEWNDLDDKSYRSVVNGNLVRQVVNRRWAKISLNFNTIGSSDTDYMLRRVNRDVLYVKAISPAFTNGYLIFKAYVSKMSAELIKGTLWRNDPSYNVSFNLIQSEVSEWQ